MLWLHNKLDALATHPQNIVKRKLNSQQTDLEHGLQMKPDINQWKLGVIKPHYV